MRTSLLLRALLLTLSALAMPPAAAATAPSGSATGGSIQLAGSGFTVNARYPVLAGPQPGIARANLEIRAFVESFVEPFVADHATTLAEFSAESASGPNGDDGGGGDGGGDGGSPMGLSWALEIDHAPPHVTERYVAIAFGGDDYRGGAHGMPVIAPLVIALDSGQPVPPAGLFKPGSDWLTPLSAYCLRELSGRDLLMDDGGEWLRAGTAPQAENYQALYPGPDGLTVTFPPYAVAPYAAGPQAVVVPYRVLRDLLSPTLFGFVTEP